MTTRHTDQDALREQVRARYAAAATKVASGEAVGVGSRPTAAVTTAAAAVPRPLRSPGSAPGSMPPSTATSCPTPRCWPAWAAATRPPWPTSTRARRSWTWARAAASTCCCRPGGSGRPAGLRAGHDRGDAGPGPPQRRRGRRHQRRVPQGPHRGHPPARRHGRRGHLQLRGQPVHRQAGVFAEIYRVLKPGGRIGITDVVAEDHLTPAERAERGAWVGCIAGALSRSRVRGGPGRRRVQRGVGDFTHQVGDGLHSAIIKATKAHSSAAATTLANRTTLPMASDSACC